MSVKEGKSVLVRMAAYRVPTSVGYCRSEKSPTKVGTLYTRQERRALA